MQVSFIIIYYYLSLDLHTAPKKCDLRIKTEPVTDGMDTVVYAWFLL